MIFLKALIIFLIGFGYGESQDPTTELVLVQMLMRHGVRSVYQIYPTDTVPASFWDKYGGLKQLTSVGMSQVYAYSQYFKNYYSNFLNPTYDLSRVYVRSTDYDRTLQSSNIFLAGLFKTNSDTKWINEVGLSSYLPIPVHTNNASTDNILHANAPCPRLDKIRGEIYNSSEWLALTASYSEFLKNMSRLSGLNLTNNLYSMWKIADTAIIEKAHNFTLPQWVVDNYEQIMITNDFTFYYDFYSIEMGKLIAGGLLNDIINNIQSKIKGSSKQLYIYTLHDNYVAAIQKLLGTSDEFKQPAFSSGFVFELRKDNLGNYYVQLLNKTNAYPEPDKYNPVQIRGCNMLCPLNKFLELTADKTVTNWDVDCADASVTTSYWTSPTTEAPTTSRINPTTSIWTQLINLFFPSSGKFKLRIFL